MVSVRRDQRLPLCWTEPVPAGPQMQLLLAKAEPASWLSPCENVFKREKNAVRQLQKRRLRNNRRKTTLQTPRSSEGGRSAPGIRAKVPPATRGENHSDAGCPPAACGEEPTPEQSIPEGLHLVVQTCPGAVLEELQPVEGPMLGQLMKDGSPWEGSHAGAGEEREEGRAAKCYELMSTQFPIPLHCSGRRRM